jgi:tetratricopeptide (TPR) repeat protein
MTRNLLWNRLWISALGCCAGLLVSCAHFPETPFDHRSSQIEKDAQEKDLNNSETLLAKGEYGNALVSFRDFQARHPQSVYLQASRLGEAQALEGLGDWIQAASIERDVSLLTLKEQPEIAALALYRLSFSYLELGEESKSVAALLDAQRLGQHLPLQVRVAEIPARLSAFYAGQGRDKEAALYLNDAEKGVDNVLKNPPKNLGKDWLAKTYYQMGSISVSQLTALNFIEFLRGERMVQVYLLKAMKLNDPQWSAQSLRYLQEMYQELDRLVTVEPARETQVQMAAAFYDLIEGADLFRPLENQRTTSYEVEFYKKLSDVRKKTEELLYSTRGGMELTEESQKLNSFKRAGRVKVDSLLPHEKKSSISLPPKIVPSEDPNL